MRSGKPKIAIDFRWFDDLNGGGQRRYSIDLIKGLANCASGFQFLILGSKEAPIPEIADVFRNSADWHYLSLPRLQGRGSIYREQLRCAITLRQHSIALFHSLHTFVPVYAPMPVVETVYDLMHELFPEYAAIVESRAYRLHRWAFKNSVHAAIAISKATAEDLISRWHFPREKVHVVYLSSDNFSDCGGTGLRDELTILSPFNLEPRKNLSTLLKAVASVRSQNVPVRLVLFGRAAINLERERKFREELGTLQIEEYVYLTGSVDEDELKRLYCTSTIFVFPSLCEGFGLPVLEAMRTGCCVLAHGDSAMAEILGDAGLLVNMTSAPEIANAIHRMLEDAPTRKRLAEDARARGSQFHNARMIQETLHVYQQVLGI